MAHISEISSGTFTTLAYVPSTSRPANAAGWLGIFDADAVGGAITVATGPAVTGTTLTASLTLTTGTDPVTGRLYELRGPANSLYFTAEEVTIGAANTTWNISMQVPSGTTAPTIGASPTIRFADGSGSVGNIREFPSLGTPANIVNVPVYGQSISSQVGGQADAPTLEFTLNYVPSVHAAIDALRQSGATQAWRVRLASAEQGSRGNGFDIFDDFYFRGSVVSFEITPSLSDSNQATITVNITGDFAGPFSIENVSGIRTSYGTP